MGRGRSLPAAKSSAARVRADGRGVAPELSAPTMAARAGLTVQAELTDPESKFLVAVLGVL